MLPVDLLRLADGSTVVEQCRSSACSFLAAQNCYVLRIWWISYLLPLLYHSSARTFFSLCTLTVYSFSSVFPLYAGCVFPHLEFIPGVVMLPSYVGSYVVLDCSPTSLKLILYNVVKCPYCTLNDLRYFMKSHSISGITFWVIIKILVGAESKCVQ